MTRTMAQKVLGTIKTHSKALIAATVVFYLCLFSIGIKKFIFYLSLFTGGISLAIGTSIYYIFIFNVRKKSPEKPPKHLNFMVKEDWDSLKQSLEVDNDLLMEPIITESFLISETLDEFIGLILKSFVSGWYSRITASTAFQEGITVELKHVFRVVKERLESVDMAKLLVSKICPILNDHLVDYIRAVERVQTKINTNKGGVAPLDHDIDVARQYRRGKIHPGVTITKTDVNDVNEKKYLRSKIGQVLPYLLSSRESGNDIGVSLVREILACTVLASIFQLLGEGDFYNLMIVKFIGDNLKRRDQVKKLRAALDEYTQKQKNNQEIDDPNKLNKDCIITENMDIISYNNCLERINQKSSLDELKQLRVYVSFQLLQAPKDTKILPRLKEVQTLVEKKIRQLESNSVITLNKALSIKVFLEEFSKFLKERNRAYLLRFWLSVEKIKAPLELHEDKLSLSLGFTNSKEVSNIYLEYLKTGIVKISDKDLHVIEEYIHSKDLTAKNTLYQKARDVLYKVQHEINGTLEIDFQEFSKTETYTKLSRQIRENEKSDGYVSPVVIKAVEDAFTQIMKSNNDFSTLDTKRQVSTVDLNKEFFGDSHSFTDSSSSSNRYSKIFDEFSDEGTDTESLNFDSDSNSNLQNSTELDPEEEPENDEDSQSLLLAAPGDLKLAEEIDKITGEIDRLNEQQSILLPLITKAELTKNISELKILRNSQLSLEREISVKELQKQQYIVQENDNSLYGKSRVTIQSYIGGNENAKDFILYIIEVQRFSNNDTNTNTSGWMIARRFSQFFKLHEYLRVRYHQVNELKFPKRTMFKLQQKQIIELRKLLLEEYLQSLLKIPEVCGDRVFRSFLSSENFTIRGDQAGTTFKRNPIESVANTFYNGISNKFSRKPSKPSTSSSVDEEMVQNLKDMEKELKSFEEREMFIKPLINLLMTVFKLKNARSWLRGRALLVILQQIFGTTIEKKIYDQLRQAHQEENVLDTLILLKNMVFPNGKFRDPPVDRTILEKETTREESKFLLNLFMGESFNTIFGVSNTKYAFTVLFNSIQNDFLMKHLVFEVFDELIGALFPEIDS